MQHVCSLYTGNLGLTRFNRISPGLMDLHWLSVLGALPDKVQTRTGHVYGADWTVTSIHYTGSFTSQYWSIVPLFTVTTDAIYLIACTRTKFGEQAFFVAGPRTWNALPEFIQSDAIETFKHHLKIHQGTVAAVPPPFRPGNPALCGSRPLVTPY